MTNICAQCGTAAFSGAVACPTCGTGQHALFRAPIPETSTLNRGRHAAIGSPSELKGIRGWLLVVGIYLVIAAILDVIAIFVDLHFLGYAATLKPGLAMLMLGEASANFVMLLGIIALNLLFYRRRRKFPRWMIAYLIAAFLIALADHVSAALLGSLASWMGVFPSLIVLLIWAPYLLRSRRVEQTFVD